MYGNNILIAVFFRAYCGAAIWSHPFFPVVQLIELRFAFSQYLGINMCPPRGPQDSRTPNTTAVLMVATTPHPPSLELHHCEDISSPPSTLHLHHCIFMEDLVDRQTIWQALVVQLYHISSYFTFFQIHLVAIPLVCLIVVCACLLCDCD